MSLAKRGTRERKWVLKRHRGLSHPRPTSHRPPTQAYPQGLGPEAVHPEE